jgi:hypothetical protein
MQSIVFDNVVALFLKDKDSIGNDSAEIAEDHSRATNKQADWIIVQESSNPAYEVHQYYFVCEAW